MAAGCSGCGVRPISALGNRQQTITDVVEELKQYGRPGKLVAYAIREGYGLEVVNKYLGSLPESVIKQFKPVIQDHYRAIAATQHSPRAQSTVGTAGYLPFV